MDDKEWVDAVVIGEDIVQREDMHMCDLVQGGLASPAYDVGRLATNLCSSHASYLYPTDRRAPGSKWPTSVHAMAVGIPSMSFCSTHAVTVATVAPDGT